MNDAKRSPATPLPLDIFVVPGSHFDLGWVLNPDGALALGDHIIHQAVQLVQEHPGYRFTIEYVLFMRHFLATFPDQREVVRRLLHEGRLEVCATSTGAMEQILDGEALVRQLTHGIRWLQAELDYTPRTAQHTDLPGHTIQMPQILARCSIPYVAYSRYRPPCPLHWWEAPDGSRVLACNHVHHYEWGRALRHDLAFAERELLDELAGPFREGWPAPQVLMPEERDLDWAEPCVCDVVKAWNRVHRDVAVMRIAVLREFFQAVETDRLPTWRGESPYGFYSIPAFEPRTYQQCRIAENALAAAERFAVLRQIEGLGAVDPSRLDSAWEDLFWPHDHNIAGQDGPINDAVRLHRAEHARVTAESVLREVDTSYLLHVRSDPRHGKAFLVFNPLSWRRGGVVELRMELPGPSVEAVEVVDADGTPVPTQLLGIERADEQRIDFQLDDPDQAEFQAQLACLAADVPAVGYKTFYVRKAPQPQPPATTVSSDRIENAHWRIDLQDGCVCAITCQRTGRQIAADGFFRVVAVEDLRGNLEDGYDPWDPRDNPPNYTGRQWPAQIRPGPARIVEHGPVRTRLRLAGTLLGDPVAQEIELYDALPLLTLRVAIDWSGHRNRQVRLRLPFLLEDPAITHETPFGSVRVGRDEMPGTYRGDGTRWVQKWIDLSEPGFGVTMSAGCCAMNLQGPAVSPLLVATTYCRGDAYYWTHNRGRHEFAFTLHTHDGDWHTHRHYAVGWEHWSPLRVVRGQPRLVSVPHRVCLPDRREYLRCDHPGVVISAFKSAADSRGQILRAFNVTGEPVTARVRTAFRILEAGACGMNEHPTAALPFEDHDLTVRLGPYEISTCRVRLARP